MPKSRKPTPRDEERIPLAARRAQRDERNMILGVLIALLLLWLAIRVF